MSREVDGTVIFNLTAFWTCYVSIHHLEKWLSSLIHQRHFQSWRIEIWLVRKVVAREFHRNRTHRFHDMRQQHINTLLELAKPILFGKMGLWKKSPLKWNWEMMNVEQFSVGFFVINFLQTRSCFRFSGLHFHSHRIRDDRHFFFSNSLSFPAPQHNGLFAVAKSYDHDGSRFDYIHFLLLRQYGYIGMSVGIHFGIRHLVVSLSGWVSKIHHSHNATFTAAVPFYRFQNHHLLIAKFHKRKPARTLTLWMCNSLTISPFPIL